MAANATAVHNVRSGRAPNIGSSGINSERPRASHNPSMGSFGSGKTSWNSTIWGDGSLGNGFTDDQHVSDTAFEGKSGSGSLLPSSQSDGWNGRPNLPWSTVSSTSSLSMAPSTGIASSPIQSRPNDRGAPVLTECGETPSYFTLPRASGGAVSHKAYLNSGSEAITPATDSIAFGSFSGFKTGEGRRQMSSSSFGTPMGSGFQVKSGLSAALDTPTSDEVAASMAMPALAHSVSSDALSQSQVRAPYTHLAQNSTSFASQRPPHSSHSSFQSENQAFESRYGSSQVDLSAGLNKLQLNECGFPTQQRPSFLAHASSYDASLNRLKHHQGMDDLNYQTAASYAAESSSELPLGYNPNRSHLSDRSSMTSTDHTRMDSPFYPFIDSPVAQYRNAGRLSESQAAALERKLRGFPQEQDYPIQSTNSLPRLPYPPAYDFAGYQAARLNALSGFYPVTQLGGLGAAAMMARPHRDHDPVQVIRSPLLEEFRANNKGNKRYELKDIYNHVVEFSGDQHGSRFIQQKLETANSDEKEQVFREIQPNSLQLMTDVFGNYVVQKLFEHGNQSQKKILANQMKGHVLALSTQMYGCRVVQKALEHILTDQQAAMVKELENHVLKCVRDQNGNHVIQKAIERVPSQYVQFIINAFKGQVNRLAAHPYGCRVIQRMLEHCEEEDRESILAELHACTTSLIPDQFGNYVIQHVIENGEEKDRSRMIEVVISQLLVYSKHKFASNVVEKSIEFGEEGQRQQIIHMLTFPNEKGESQLLGLMRDQYGNYVIQKVLGQLKGVERDALVEQIKPLLSQLKKFSYGKQIVAIEKLIFDHNSSSSNTLHNNNASSSTPPNSHKSSPLPVKRSLTNFEHGRAPVVGGAPPTPPPTDSQSPVDSKGLEKGFAKSSVTAVSESEVDSTASTVSLTARGVES
ncbi:mRNA binding protein puf3 [Monascus purpureus]|uniref:Pumilio homology domain family member 3 n=1 Tax=Monascus purpureus TaxID=5098 RepID=A0A507QYG0_MONPU|nr:mRNA binding protein puf3 [Monascus purpureus]BDD61790.1 hypothetical protein MAP00_006815 [Monascus purpureus]